MSNFNWNWKTTFASAALVILCLASEASVSAAPFNNLSGPLSTASIHRGAGVEIGNANIEIGMGSGAEMELPAEISSWSTRVSESYTELVAPADAKSSIPTKLRISVKEAEQPNEDSLKEMEELGWKRFSWADMEGLRMERLTSRNRGIRAVEVRLFRAAREAIELVLIGNTTTQSFSSLYEWLTPKEDEHKESETL